jgi:hypothetical protein
MDVIVTPAGEEGNAWNLTDLLGRSMGQIVEEEAKQFFIDPAGLAIGTMQGIAPGPYPSLDAALAEIEKHTRGVCRHAPEPRSGQR